MLKQETPELDIRQIRPKHLSIIVNEFGIDTSKYKGKTLSEYYDFIEQEYKKIKPNYEVDFFAELKRTATILTTSFVLSKSKNIEDFSIMPHSAVIGSFRNIDKSQERALLTELHAINDTDFPMCKRTFFDDENSQLENLSYPDELIKETHRDENIFKVYGHMKFQQLSQFIEQNKNLNKPEN